MPYLYAYAGAPCRTQETVRAAMTGLWSTQPGGIPGNDDLGRCRPYVSSPRSSACIRRSPPAPSRLASPLFTRVEINRPGGNDIEIHANGAAAEHARAASR